jgi:hypothetical protein
MNQANIRADWIHFLFSEGWSCDVYFFVSEEADPSTMLPLSFRSPVEDPTVRFSIYSYRISTPSSDVAALLLLGSLFHCYIPCPSVVSSRTSVLYDRVPYAVQERQCRSTFLEERPTSAGTHHRPESASSAAGRALRLDAGPRIGPPVLR